MMPKIACSDASVTLQIIMCRPPLETAFARPAGLRQGIHVLMIRFRQRADQATLDSKRHNFRAV
jgi:hypothetical protein